MTEHTKEPWTAHPCPCGQRGCSSAVIAPMVVHTQGAMSMDDARRAAACVNACAGISTEELETVPGADVGSLKRLMDVANDAAIAAYIAYQRGES